MISIVLYLLVFCMSVNAAFDFTEYTVPCNTSTEYCDCPSEHNGRKIDVCVFNLKIRALQTFTRYPISAITDDILVRKGGKVWYIDKTNGTFNPFPDSSTICSRPLTDNSCTEPLAVDGKSFRSVITVNGHFPGPTLIVNYNQTLVMNVTNLLESQTISIHFHGLHQRRTNWMDGVEQLTQCGIAPGNTFTQIFQADPSGTFWYHSHTGGQRTEGLFGAIVIKEPPSVVNKAQAVLGAFNDLPQEHTMMLSDFYDTSLFNLYYLIHIETPLYFTDISPDPSYYSPPNITKSSDGAEVGPVPFWSALINGKGRHPDVGYNKSRLSIFSIAPSERYRFRVAGAQNGFGFRVSIDEHKLVVMSTDGALMKPMEVDFVIVQAGERYDFLVSGKSIDELNGNYNYIIRAETLETYDPIKEGMTRQPIKGHMAEAILHYNIVSKPKSTDYNDIANRSVPTDTRCTSKLPCIALNCPFKIYPPSYNITCLHVHMLELLSPLPDEALPDIQPEEYLFFNIGFEGSSQTSSFNARNSILPSSPLSLLNITQLQDLGNIEYCKKLDNPAMCADTLDVVLASDCICTHVQDISFNKSVQLVYSGISPNPEYLPTYKSTHPTHLHGHYFQVVDVQFGNYTPNGLLSWSNEDIYCGGAKKVCTVPQWAKGKDFSRGKKGKVSNTAPLKDSISVPSGGYVVTYLRSDNPGHWFSHCHIENHQLAGMRVILSEAKERIESPPNGMSQCGNVFLSVSDYFEQVNGGPRHGQDSSGCSGDQLPVTPMILLVQCLFLSLYFGLLCAVITCIHFIKRSNTRIKTL